VTLTAVGRAFTGKSAAQATDTEPLINAVADNDTINRRMVFPQPSSRRICNSIGYALEPDWRGGARRRTILLPARNTRVGFVNGLSAAAARAHVAPPFFPL
jgi:hypothetical protein